MPRALVDTTVLFAAAYRPDGAHDDALPILQGIDTADLPEAVVLDYVLAETLNGLTTHAGHDAATDFLDRIEENARFHIDSLTGDAFVTGKALFRRYEQFSFVDACIVAYQPLLMGDDLLPERVEVVAARHRNALSEDVAKF
ncbi:PIN domain-containing protein [Haloarcula sp. JP-L23]|jgi:predicted nucleic acid-binding protein|uniref:PIN domain-containing protein n=1 Tax=Haloarcula sp. JP-L23 TaxID=2716717 RepID=UPI00140EE91A|nr:PIN domain-containing protein [Haloarcula sp. JP-L23]